MVTFGSNHDEPIRCRTFDRTAVYEQQFSAYLFQTVCFFFEMDSRGLAPRLAWHVLINVMRSSGDSLMGMIEIISVSVTALTHYSI